MLTGKGAVLTFDDAGEVRECSVIGPDEDDRLVEIPAGTWHTLVALEPGTVWFEVKAGPYTPPPPQDVADWAPEPSDPRAVQHVERWRALASAA